MRIAHGEGTIRIRREAKITSLLPYTHAAQVDRGPPRRFVHAPVRRMFNGFIYENKAFASKYLLENLRH